MIETTTQCWNCNHTYSMALPSCPTCGVVNANQPTKWDRRFMDLADLVATWSKDPSTRVGAVLVDSKHRVISLGFNGFPRGADDDDLPRERKLLRTVHAEVNALLFANCPVAGATLYVTHHPCGHCAATLVQAGITRVVIPEQQTFFSDRWNDHLAEAQQLFCEAGVFFDKYERSYV